MAPDQYEFQMAIHDFQSAQHKTGIPEVLGVSLGIQTSFYLRRKKIIQSSYVAVTTWTSSL